MKAFQNKTHHVWFLHGPVFKLDFPNTGWICLQVISRVFRRITTVHQEQLEQVSPVDTRPDWAPEEAESNTVRGRELITVCSVSFRDQEKFATCYESTFMIVFDQCSEAGRYFWVGRSIFLKWRACGLQWQGVFLMNQRHLPRSTIKL